jgi:Leucine-rich repeat (LRR) protein
MKSIQLINPQHASELLKPYKYSFIQVLTTDKPIVLANANSFSAEQVQGLQIEIKMGSAYKIDLANYAKDITLELRDLEWGILFLINNTEHLLRVKTSATEKDYVQMDKFPELQIIDFRSGLNEHLTNINLLSAFKNLSTLDLSDCKSLSDLIPLSGLTNLSTLDLSRCESLSDLTPLTGLTNLSTLDLYYCKSLSDLSPLAGLTNLTTLNLSSRESLNDLSPLAGLTNLTTLNLSNCRSLTDLTPLAGLTNLSTLYLYGCQSLNDLSPLVGLTNLSTLNLGFCRSLTDLPPLVGLTNLSTLDLSDCKSLSDLTPLTGLTNLSTLDLSRCESLSDLTPLTGLTNLSTLDLYYCKSLSDLSPLAGLTNLTTLNLSSSESLNDLSPLAGLTNLTTLNLSNCRSLTDLTPLVGLTNLSTLDLSDCKSLSDLIPLSGLTNLSTLYLKGCTSLSDLIPLSGLTNLSTLNLSYCESLIFVKHLAKLKNLIDLDLKFSGNIRDFEELINCPNLKKVAWTEKAICAYVLAGSAIKRKDFYFIENNISAWIQDIKFSKNPNAFATEIIAASVFIKSKAQATTHLINASSQISSRGLADGEKGNAITVYVWELWADAALQLGAEHFTACFEKVLKNLNPEREIEVLLSPILTALADVPIQYPSAKTWALNLVSQTLLPICAQEDAARMAAPAAAVFYAGMQMPEEVFLWLKRGTHPNIPRWKDTVFLALVNYYATKNNFVKAREYTSQIELPDVKDQARILLAESMAGTMPKEALEEFASISDLLQQIALAKKLMLEPNITSNSKGIYQLLLCLEQSPTDLGDFIKTLLSQNPESKLVKTIEGLFAKEAQVTSVSATALLTICANPSITDFISNRVLERLKQELQEIAANERLYLNKELTAQLIEKNLLPAADEKDFLQALNN